LFSATLDGDVDVLVRRYQRDPVRHELAGEPQEQGDVRHFFWRAVKNERVEIARDIVKTMAPAIVFTRTKHGADRLSRQLNRHGVRAAAIHGNRSQNQRERALADLTGGKVAALVATDVAARGIHVDDVGVVLHYDRPETEKDYVHRSGRTGRAGADGVVVTLVTPDKSSDVRTIQRKLAMREQIGTSDLRDLRNPSAGQWDGDGPQTSGSTRRRGGRSRANAAGRTDSSRNGASDARQDRGAKRGGSGGKRTASGNPSGGQRRGGRGRRSGARAAAPRS
jgi:superfamily II DNA/RNA helicase